jgi:hypothetical protein
MIVMMDAMINSMKLLVEWREFFGQERMRDEERLNEE